MPGGFGTPYRAPCGGWPSVPKLYLGCGNKSVASHKTYPRTKNYVTAPSAPCDPEVWATPTPRPQNSTNFGQSGCEEILIEGVPTMVGVGPWPEPVINTYGAPPPGEETVDLSDCSKRGFKNVYAQKQWCGAFPTIVDTIAINGDCQCRIFASAQNDPIPYKYRQFNITGEWIYRLAGEPSYTSFIDVGGSHPRNQSIFSSDLIHRHSGKRTGFATRYAQDEGGTYDSNSSAFEAFLNQILGMDATDIIDVYCAGYSRADAVAAAQTPVDSVTITSGTSATYFYEKITSDPGTIELPNVPPIVITRRFSGQINFSTAAIGSTRQIHIKTTDETRTEFESFHSIIEEFEITLNGATLSYRSTRAENGRYGATAGGTEIDELTVKTCGRQGYTTYHWSHVQEDLDTLLATWNLGDDLQYPWRDTTVTAIPSLHSAAQTTNTIVTGGPLVTYNERGSSVPGIWPLGELIDPENPASNHHPWVDTSLPPRTNYPDGGIVGAPLPYGHDAFFDSHHIHYEFVEETYGIQAIEKTYGQLSPFPHATQWLTNAIARYIPVGPFSTYNGILHPELTTSSGYAINLGLAAFKCKWAEAAIRPAPSHNFFRPCGSDSRVTWPSDYRALCGRVPITSATQSGAIVLIVLAEAAPGLITGDLVDFTTVPGLGAGLAATVTDPTHFSVTGTLTTSPTLGGFVSSNGAPSYGWNDTNKKGDFIYKVWVNDYRDFIESYRQRLNYLDAVANGCSAANTAAVRYVPQTFTPGERDEIGSGSYWLKSLTITEHCLSFSPCNPAVIYVSPNTETGHANSITLPMPGVGLVADDQFSSLWIGRVEQTMPDPLGVVAYEEARSTLPSGAPALPTTATPLGCPDYVAQLNADPPVVVGGDCSAQYQWVLQYDTTTNNYIIISAEPQAMTLAWGI